MATLPASAPSPSTPSGADPRPLQFREAVDTVRATAKWLIAAFAAVGAALAASIPLSSFGDAQGSRLWLAVIGASLAFGGIALAILSVSHVLTPSFLNLDRVTTLISDDVASDKTLLAGASSSLPDLTAKLRSSQIAAQDADLNYSEAVRDAPIPSDPASQIRVDTLRREKEFCELRRGKIAAVMGPLRGLAFYKEVMARFSRARRDVALGAGLIAAGLLLFTYGSAASTHGNTRYVLVREIPGPPGPPGARGSRGPQGPPGELPYSP
jgi:hypothetical protein